MAATGWYLPSLAQALPECVWADLSLTHAGNNTGKHCLSFLMAEVTRVTTHNKKPPSVYQGAHAYKWSRYLRTKSKECWKKKELIWKQLWHTFLSPFLPLLCRTWVLLLFLLSRSWHGKKEAASSASAVAWQSSEAALHGHTVLCSAEGVCLLRHRYF